MSGQDTQFEEEPKQEKKTMKRREAGHDSEGKPSEAALKSWLLWAGLALGVCLVVALILAVVSSGQNKKEAAVLEVEAETVMRFTLNRKGTVLEVQEGDKKLLKADLEACCREILLQCMESGCLEEKEGVLFTIESRGESVRLNAERMAEEICVYADAFLKKKQAKGTVYVGTVGEDARIRSLAAESGCSFSKAALAADLVDENIRLKTADEKRLSSLSMRELSAEILEQKYNTSFSMVTAGKIYQKKADETVKMTETKEEKTTADQSETETREPESLTETETEPASGDEEEIEEAQEETEAEGGEAPENRQEEEDEEGLTESQTEIWTVPPTEPQESTMKPPVEPAPETTGAVTQAPTVPETAVPETTVPSPLETAPPETSAPAAIVPEPAALETSGGSAYYPSGPAGPGFETESAPTDAVIQQVVPLSPVGY